MPRKVNFKKENIENHITATPKRTLNLEMPREGHLSCSISVYTDTGNIYIGRHINTFIGENADEPELKYTLKKPTVFLHGYWAICPGRQIGQRYRGVHHARHC